MVRLQNRRAGNLVDQKHLNIYKARFKVNNLHTGFLRYLDYLSRVYETYTLPKLNTCYPRIDTDNI